MRFTRVYDFLLLLLLLYLLTTVSICIKLNPVTILKVSCIIFSLYLSRVSDTRNSVMCHSLWWSDELCVMKSYLTICILSRINDKCMHYQKAMINQNVDQTMTVNLMSVCSYKYGGKIENTDFPKVNAAVKIRSFQMLLIIWELNSVFPDWEILQYWFFLGGGINFDTNHACLTVFIPTSDLSLKENIIFVTNSSLLLVTVRIMTLS